MGKEKEVQLDFHYSDYLDMNAPRGGIKGFFDKHKTILQMILFMFLSLLCFVAQIIVNLVVSKIFEKTGYTQQLDLGIFSKGLEEYSTLNTFIGFLAANVVAKVLSFVLNYKTTFNSNSNKLFSIIGYVIMVVALIIAESLVGPPLTGALTKGFYAAGASEGDFWVNEDFCKTLSLIIYSAADFVIVFLMDKFVLMRQVEEKQVEQIETMESGIVCNYDELA